ncbi:MAG: hypothetical protein BM564_05870 [Bacteroidetes bacterium MedPE-SWsnd-G2]|nr:MAG: hypothetical protein BM564_05870 [Bacteroidetes bacterium MedPE-SWsnd-G2]
MKTITSRFYYLFILTLFTASIAHSQSSAIYDISFQSSWNSTDHGTVPGNAHWSNLVGATHNASIRLLEMGQLASPGIKSVAEAGVNTNLFNEVSDYISDGDADQWLQQGFSPFAAISSATLEDVTVSEDFPLLSLVSMIAPSPDWIIAINSFNLRDGDSWKDNISIDLFAYDAGTDSGTDYTSSNLITDPFEPISSLINVAPFGSEKMGTLTITLVSTTLGINQSDVEQTLIYPNPAKNELAITAHQANPIENIALYDVLGKKILQKNSNSTSISNVELDISNLNQGIYILKVDFTNGNSINRKIIKQ